jgi:hypothetical protein
MVAALSAGQVLSLVLAGMATGAGLLMVLAHVTASAFGDDSCSGCCGLGLFLLLLAVALSLLVLF